MQSALAGVLALLALLTVGAAPVPQLTDVVVAADSRYSCLRVPSSVKAPLKYGGDVLIFLEARKGSCNDQAPKDIVLFRSSDSGASWEGPTVVLGAGPDSTSNTTYRNPYAVVTAQGTLVLQCVNSTLSEPWVTLQLHSQDGGRSFGPAIAIGGVLQREYDGILPGPGQAIMLQGSDSPARGRIIGCGATGYHAGHAMEAALWYSDDNGSTWSLSTPTFPGMAECQAAELSDGRVMVSFRARHENSTCDCRAQALSSDGGATWLYPQTYVPALVEPVCAAGLLGLGRAGLYFSNPASRTSRVNMTLRWSNDDGETWPHSLLLWGGPSAYSTLVGLGESPGGGQSVGVVFERGSKSPYERITFAKVPVE